MDGLGTAKPIAIVCTRDRSRAALFYRDILGLPLVSEDSYAAVFNVGGTVLRLSTVADWVPHDHTIMGFHVPDVGAAVEALQAKGVSFNRYNGFNQDELGVLTLPQGAGHVAWFKDPDGNVLSITDV